MKRKPAREWNKLLEGTKRQRCEWMLRHLVTVGVPRAAQTEMLLEHPKSSHSLFSPFIIFPSNVFLFF